MAERNVYDLELDDLGENGFKALSLVDYPAIEEDFIYFSKQPIQFKSEDERRMVFGPVLIPDKLIYRRDDKTGEEYYLRIKAPVIRELAYRMLKQGKQSEHTLMHEAKVNGLHIVESWIKESEQDKSVALGFNLPIGTWFVGDHIEDDEAWSKVKSGEYRGFSIEMVMDHVLNFMRFADHETILAELKNLVAQVA